MDFKPFFPLGTSTLNLEIQSQKFSYLSPPFCVPYSIVNLLGTEAMRLSGRKGQEEIRGQNSGSKTHLHLIPFHGSAFTLE